MSIHNQIVVVASVLNTARSGNVKPSQITKEDRVTRVIPGQMWLHHSGRMYEVLMLANESTQRPAEYPVTIIYRGNNGQVWAKTEQRFRETMTYSGQQSDVYYALEVLRLAPELNMSNYTHDEVTQLNTAVTEAYSILAGIK